MFESKIDKFMCFICLHSMGLIFGIQHGVMAYFPFAAAAILSYGMSVKEPTK